MEYRKLEYDHYNLHLIKTDKFKTISVKVNLKRPIVKEEITIRNLLVNSMLESTEHYKTRRELEQIKGLDKQNEIVIENMPKKPERLNKIKIFFCIFLICFLTLSIQKI